MDKKAVLKGIIDMIPDDLQIQVRLPRYKNLIPMENIGYERIGFHDDFIVVKPHDWDGGLRPGTDEYCQIAEQAPFLLIDGELPWGYWSLENGGWIIDGYGAAIRLADHRYTSLSLIHNYHENGNDIKYSFTYWKELAITEEWL